MALIEQATKDEWNNLYGYEFLCALPLSIFECETQFDIAFEAYQEGDLGQCFAAVIKVNSRLYFLQGLDVTDEEYQKGVGTFVNMQGNNSNPEESLVQVVAAFGLNLADLPYICEDLSPPKWILTQHRDDGKEVEVTRFLSEHTAIFVQKRFSGRGHKPCYMVRQAS